MKIQIDQAITRALQQHGLRPTRARQLILALIEQDNQHYTPEEMLVRLNAMGERLSIATLYQNLAKLVDKGLLVKFVGLDGEYRYDYNKLPHHHLICESCGRIVDVLVDQALDAIDPRLMDANGPKRLPPGWKILQRRVDFIGVCPDCSQQMAEN